jgi:hypothetical protein
MTNKNNFPINREPHGPQSLKRARREITRSWLCRVLFPIDDNESSFTPGEQISRRASNFPLMIQLAALAARHKSLHDNFRIHTNGSLVLDAQVRRDRVLPVKAGRLAHNLIQQQGNDPAMEKARTALVFLAQAKTPHNALALVILFERKVHAAGVGSAAAKAWILRFGIDSHFGLFEAPLATASNSSAARLSGTAFSLSLIAKRMHSKGHPSAFLRKNRKTEVYPTYA